MRERPPAASDNGHLFDINFVRRRRQPTMDFRGLGAPGDWVAGSLCVPAHETNCQQLLSAETKVRTTDKQCPSGR